MKKLLVAFTFLFSFSLFAQTEQPRHLISIGTDGFGWSGIGNIFDWDKDESGIKKHESSSSELILNYSFIFPNRVMLGAFIFSETSESTIKLTDGSKVKSEDSSTEFGVGVGYNFNEDLFNSWWVQAIVSSGKWHEKSKDLSGTDESDDRFTSFYLKLGKRINLDSWGLKNISYNPSITFATAKFSGDMNDMGLEKASQFQLEIIKFDILF